MDRVKSILNGCAEIFFLQGAVAGGLFLAITLLCPRQALPALIALAAAYAFALLVGVEEQFLQSGHFVYNPVLVGLSVGHLCELSPAACLLAALAGVVAFLVTAVLARALVGQMHLPVLSLPFVLTSSLVWIVATRYGNVLPPPAYRPSLLTTDLGMPLWAAGLLKSFGALVFAPCVIVGLLLALLVLRYSRILFLLAVTGYYLGTLLHGVLLGSIEQSLQDPSHFNFYLIAMAVGGVFLVPSLRSGLVAMVAVAATSLTLEAFITLGLRIGIPPFTLPFCVMTLVTIYVLRLVNSPLLFAGFGRTPEEVRENSLVSHLRYRGSERSLHLPFSGKWSVWQGFNGRWTHQGDWRYAYDFVVVDDQGKTHRGEGVQLQDYYCYRMPVLAPVAGRVVRVVDSLPDNTIGTVSGGTNWGNHVVLHDPRGFYVELSHFVPQSIRVKEGESVERGAVLGLCGNSGYSPQPHIHVQAQATDSAGAATIAFSFANYACHREKGDSPIFAANPAVSREQDLSAEKIGTVPSEPPHLTYHANDLPQEQDQIEPLCLDKRLDEATSFVVDDVLQYDVFRDGQPDGQLRLRVRIAPDGTYYLDTDRGQLYFGKHQGTFYFYRFEGDDPHLPLFLLALPRLPLAYHNRLQWHDHVPVSVAARGIQRAVARLGSLVWPQLASIAVTQAFAGRNLLESTAESKILGLRANAETEFDDQNGIARLRLGSVELRRVNDPDRRGLAAASAQPRSLTRSKILMATAVFSLAALAAVVGVVAETNTDTAVQQAVQQSVVLEGGKDYTRGIAALMEPYAARRDNYFLNVRLGWLYYLSGKHADADRYYQAAVKAAPEATEAKLGEMLPLLADGKLKEAESLGRLILKDHPKSYYGNLRLAVALRLQKKTDEARQIVAEMLVAYPSDVYYLGEKALLGPAPNAPGGVSSAGPAEASGVEVPNAEATKKSLELEAALNYAEAIHALGEVYDAHPRDYFLNLRLGWLNYLAADYRNSAHYYYTAMQIAPKSIEAGLGYTLPLLAQGRYKDAESLAAQIVQGDSGNYFGNVRLAFALRMQGRLDEAEKVVDRMLAAYPAGTLLLLERGMLHLARNQKEDAREVFSRVLMLDPDNATAKEQIRGL